MNPQSHCLRLAIPLSTNSLRLKHVLHFGHSISEIVTRTGGKSRCFKTADAVVVEQTGVSRIQLQKFVDAMATAVAKNDNSLTMVIEERDAPEIDLDTEGIIPGEYVRPRLTKNFLFSLPEGAIVVGNSIINGEINFIARMEPGKDRSRIWREAVRRDAAQRICDIFWNPKDVLEVHGINLHTRVDDGCSTDIPPTVRM